MPALLPDPPTLPKKRRLGNLGKLVIGFGVLPVLLLLTAELLLRLLGPGLPGRGDVRADVKVMRRARPNEAPGVGWVLDPGSRVLQSYDEPDGLGGWKTREVVYQINSLGFRGPEASLRPGPDVWRIAVLGDSFTFGTAIRFEHTWPEVLRRTLERVPGSSTRVEVLNFAMEAIHTGQEVALLENRVLAFEPDLVIVAVHANDASGSGIEPPPRPESDARVDWIVRLGLTSGRRAPGAERSPAERRLASWRSASRLVDLIAHRMYFALYGSIYVENCRADWAAGSAGRAAFRTALKRASELSRLRGFELLIVHYPVLTGLRSDYPLEPVRDAIALEARELGLDFLDLLPAFHGQDGKSLWAHPHDFHPGPRANQIAGAAVAAHLLAHPSERRGIVHPAFTNPE